MGHTFKTIEGAAAAAGGLVGVLGGVSVQREGGPNGFVAIAIRKGMGSSRARECGEEEGEVAVDNDNP